MAWVVVVAAGVRVASLPLVHTWFVPDEYWQASEVAHHMAFSYGYRTWEWQEGIRGVLYPATIAALYRGLAYLGADTPALLIQAPRLLQVAAFAVGDYHIWRLSKALYGSASAGWTVVCLATAWFLAYCAPRTLTSCVETVLLAVAFSHYPWRRLKESSSAGYLWALGLACAVRPTAGLPFLPLALHHLTLSPHKARLLLHYLAITAATVAATVAADSWYYGALVVVPWRFLHFNVVSGLSGHYGTLPWHWYLSQALPATLTTHLLPLLLALTYHPSRHKELMPVVLWSLFVYSCLGHKEFRFLLPVLPLCLCVAGDYIAFHLAAHTKRSGQPATLRRNVIFLGLLIPNLVVFLYFGLVHQRGPLDTMQALRQEVHTHPHASILFLMPCHSTPYYSHLHTNVSMRFLTCEPNLKGEEHYLDEADVFDKDPMAWLQQHFSSQPPALPKPALSRVIGSNGLRSFVSDLREKDEESEETEAIVSDKEVREAIVSVEVREEDNKQEAIDVREERENAPTKPSPNFPSHIVMFSVLKDKIIEFLDRHHYHLCHEIFHSHFSDGRTSQYIYIYCRQPATLLT